MYFQLRIEHSQEPYSALSAWIRLVFAGDEALDGESQDDFRSSHERHSVVKVVAAVCMMVRLGRNPS